MVMREQPLRVLLVIETGGGGSGRHFIDLASGLVQRGAQVHAVYSALRAEQAFVEQLHGIAGLTLKELAMHRAPHPLDLRALWQLAAYIRRHRFDIVHGHSSKAGALVRLAGLFGPAQRVYTPHALVTMNPDLGGLGRMAYGLVERFLGTASTDTLIAVSEDELAHAERLGIARSRLALVRNGIEPCDDARYKRLRVHARARLGAGHGDVVVGWVGRMSFQKAPERFVALARRLARDRPTARFVMLGDGELAEAVDAEIRSSGLDGQLCRLSGARGVDFMPAFDMLVMTSRYEAMSYVLIEALDAGLPLVTMEVGGARTVIDPDHNGFIVPNSDDVGLLAQRVSSLLDDPALRQAMGAHSRDKAKHFLVDRMVAETLAVYQQVCFGGRSRRVPVAGGTVARLRSRAGLLLRAGSRE